MSNRRPSPRAPASGVVNQHVMCVELAPRVPLPTGTPRHMVSDDGWRLILFRSSRQRYECLLITASDGPVFLSHAYSGEAPGVLHGTDCVLTLWAAAGGVGGVPPNCLRLAAGGFFRTLDLREMYEGDHG